MKPVCMLQLCKDGWWAACWDGTDLTTASGACQSIDSGAEGLCKALGEIKWQGQTVLLAPPSDRVYPASIAIENLPRRGRRQAMLYRLEEHLPIDAEQLTGDFLPIRGGSGLGVAILTGPAREAIQVLASFNIEVVSIVPAALLACWQWIEQNRSVAGQASYLLIDEPGDEAGSNVFRLEDCQPAAWYTGPCEDKDVIRTIKADRFGRNDTSATALIGIGPWAGKHAEAIAESADLDVLTGSCDSGPAELAMQAAARRLAGRSAGWVDLRREELAPRSLLARSARLVKASAVASVFLLVVVAAALYWKTVQYENTTRDLRSQQVQLFLRSHPGQPAPPDVRLRLESDLKRLAGIRGTNDAVPELPNALVSLRRILSSLPETMRLRIVDLRLDQQQLLLEGQVRNHSHAETIRTRLIEAGFEVGSPRTEHLAGGGVQFTLAGQLSGAAAFTGVLRRK